MLFYLPLTSKFVIFQDGLKLISKEAKSVKHLLFLFLAIFLALASCAPININKGLLGAAEKGEVSKVCTFLEKGADINVRDEYDRTPLMLAAYGGHTEVVKILLGSGADVNAEGKYGATALSFATARNHDEIVQLLKEK